MTQLIHDSDSILRIAIARLENLSRDAPSLIHLGSLSATLVKTRIAWHLTGQSQGARDASMSAVTGYSRLTSLRPTLALLYSHDDLTHPDTIEAIAPSR